MVHEGRWVNFLTMVGKLETSTVCLRDGYHCPQDGYQCPATRQR